MIYAKIWGWGAIGSLVVAMVGQVAALDGTAVIFYIGAIGMAVLALYSKARETKRQQDVADREARKGDCEEQLKAIKEVLAEQRQLNGDLRREVEWWKALSSSGSKRPSNQPPRSPRGTTS